jgi:glucose/arabinose dehydrogenase
MRLMSRPSRAMLLMAMLLATAAGCYAMRGSSGGGQVRFTPPRQIDPADIALPPGYRIEAVAHGLTFPSGVAFDDQHRAHVVEAGYAYGEVWATPRLVRVEPDGLLSTVATGGRNGPWNGVTFHDGAFYVAEGGVLEGGRILRITPEGNTSVLADQLPSHGDHHTNGPVIGPDGAIYFGQGTFTNAAVVGEDNHAFGWLSRHPGAHDVPCADVTLTGRNVTTRNPLDPAGGRVSTGAFSPFGVATEPGQVVRGRVPCNGAILKIPAGGGPPALVAWGLRNPYGLAFASDGTLYVTDNSYDERGSRPVWGTGDLLIRIEPGRWYGWPDYHGDQPLSSALYDPPGGPRPEFLLQEHPDTPPPPVALLGVHSSATGFDFSSTDAFGHVGQALVAQFGDIAPAAGKVLRPVGFKVVRVDVTTGVIEDFAVNRGRTNGPASRLGGGGLERPIAARFSPDGAHLYVVDFGVMTTSGAQSVPRAGTGVLWRIWREGAAP